MHESSAPPLAMLHTQVDPRGKTWNRLRASIGQPNFVNGEESAIKHAPLVV